MIAVDTSVLVAAFASWHEGHAASAKVMGRSPRLPAHVLIETYSVLTRLPPPHRAAAGLVAAYLHGAVAEPPLVLPPREHLRLVNDAAVASLSGGSIHDALIAATALHAGACLMTRDRRAIATYELFGVKHELVG